MGSDNSSAIKLQRRIVQSQYIMAVSEAGFDPPQGSGLTNSGCGIGAAGIVGICKTAPFQHQGYAGVRWVKENDPTGRSAPGEMNSLIIWQQPHPMQFAEYEWRSFPTVTTLENWDHILGETADFMLYMTLDRQCILLVRILTQCDNEPYLRSCLLENGTHHRHQMASSSREDSVCQLDACCRKSSPLPVQQKTYVIYEGISDMWDSTDYDEDHPSMLGIYGWLPPQDKHLILS
ncbi:hypothetical protein M433DRAFT_175215 [Acidomyces richmondensis BFW]|nr:hypothetical protein M433DRAFT_175215 [Acidomyces richmondensis BFW]